MVVVSCTTLVCLAIGLAAESADAEEMEILKITVGEPTKLSSQPYQNSSVVMVSRTGVVAVIYVKPGREPRYPEKTRRGTAMGYRISTDGGDTWGEEMFAPDEFGGGQCSGTLRDGGVIIPVGSCMPSTEQTRAPDWDGQGERSDQPPADWEKGWFDTRFLRFSDDFRQWHTYTARVYIPDQRVSRMLGEFGPGWTKGKMIHLPNGQLLSPMAGAFRSDGNERALLVRSNDQGRTWHYHGTIAYQGKDPNPELPGHYVGCGEPSIALLPNGQMLAMLRKQWAHYPGEYKPMSTCWSDDLGRTWTQPTPTKPHLMNISPTLQVLDNGVVACEYGRPGCHVAFSIDNGHTWQDHISFSDLAPPGVTGQFDMVKAGPNKLVLVGSDAEGTKAWPIIVERVKVSPDRVALQGRVLDQQGNPIAGAQVERGPNRYALDAWMEDDKLLDVWKAGPLTVGLPKLSYRSIRGANGHPTVQTDTEGRFRFKSVKLGEYVLTVEGEGYAPQQRHIKVGPEAKPQEFLLKPGRKVCNQVVDDTGHPVSGACVVLNGWHVHTDSQGYYHWSVVEATMAKQVTLRVYKRWSGDYETLKTSVALSQLESHPIVLARKN